MSLKDSANHDGGLRFHAQSPFFARLNFYVLCFGTVGLPFGLCLLLSVGAFKLTVRSTRTAGVSKSFLAGAVAGAAVASSLLTTPIVLVLAGWLALRKASDRNKKLLSFLAGATVPLLPVVLIGLRAPHQVFFDLVEYHLFHRVGSEGNMIRWNLRELFNWFGSIQGIILTALAVVGFGRSYSQTEPDDARRSEIFLCGLISIAVAVFLAIPRPTFSFYFLLLTRFVSILAALGLERILSSDRMRNSGWVLAVVLGLYCVGLGPEAYKMRREIFHSDHSMVEMLANQINQVTPADGWVFAFEQVYFEAGRLPPPGLENSFNPYSKANQWLAENRFATVCMMANDPRVKDFDLFGRYSESAAVSGPDFTVYLFWNRAASPSPGVTKN